MNTQPFLQCRLALILAVLFFWHTGQVCAQTIPISLRTFLETKVGFSAKELAAINRDILVKQVPMHDKKREFSLVAVVRMDTSQDRFISYFRKIDHFMKNGTVHQIGLLSDPPQAENLASLQLPESDFEELARCRLGACKVKLPAEALHRLQSIDWSSPLAAKIAMDLFRTGIANYVRAYTEHGNGTLMVYADKEQPMTIASGFASLHAQGDYLYRSHPELMGYLSDFTRPPPEGVEDFFFWSLEDFGQRPTFTVTQAAIYQPKGQGDRAHTVALKQIYTTHYFQARLQLMDLIPPNPSAQDTAFYLLYLDRLRFDADINAVNRMLISKNLLAHVKSWLHLLRANLQDAHLN